MPQSIQILTEYSYFIGKLFCEKFLTEFATYCQLASKRPVKVPKPKQKETIN